jgi:tRNA modification GTPase
MLEGLHKIVSDDETIVAISTPLGQSGIGVIRISGRHCQSIAGRLFKPNIPNSELQHRTVLVGTWHDHQSEEIDQVVLTFFQGPHSYTGEDVLEVSAHGNPMTLQRIVDSARQAGSRLAGPGEFTLRAVANGKMDLIQAEAVKAFIEAQTECQAKTALRQMDGAIAKHVRPIKETLVDVIAHLEAAIDFADDDIDVPANGPIANRIYSQCEELVRLRDTFGYGKLLAKGVRLTILGKPNVGKSSVFNRLVAAERAIVTDVPGTTRDVLTETISLDGVPLCFVDTAGVRHTTDQVESIGVIRTFEALAETDLALVVLDGSRPLDDNDRQVLEKAGNVPHLIVINKIDLNQVIQTQELNGAIRVSVSARTGFGFEEFQNALKAVLLSQKTSLANELVLTNVRQYDAVTNATTALIAAGNALRESVPHEMVLLDLYRALSALDELTGDVVTEDILGRIFSTFCIGK